MILITVITSLVDSSDELLKTITAYSLLSIAGLATAGGLIGLLFLVFLLVVGFRRHGNIEDPYLFNEMQFTLGGILRPLGFTLATQDHQGQKYAEFTRDKLHVLLSWEDKECWLYMYDKSAVADDKKGPKPDFAAVCRRLKKADQFKSESIVKLNEWLVTKKLK